MQIGRTYIFLLVLLAFFLIGCKDKYDRLERSELLRPYETGLATALGCEDVIMTVGQVTEDSIIQSTFQIFLINSDSVSLSDSDEINSNICYNLSRVMVRDHLELPSEHKYIEIQIVERTKNLISSTSAYYGKVFEIEKLAKQLN